MTIISRVPWSAMCRKTLAVAAVCVLGLAGSLSLAGSARATAGMPSTQVAPGLAASALPAKVLPGTPSNSKDKEKDGGKDQENGKVQDKDSGKLVPPAPVAPATTSPAKPLSTVRPTATKRAQPASPAHAPANPAHAPAKPAATKAPVQPSPSAAPSLEPTALEPTSAPAVSETKMAEPPAPESPWPTFVNTETAQGVEPAGASGGIEAASKSAAAVDAELSLANQSSTGPGLMTWLLVLLGLTLAAGVAVGLYAMTHLRGQRHG